MITVLPPAINEPVLESCIWPSAGIPLGTNGVVAVTVRGGNTARSVHFNVKKAGTPCAVSASVSVPGDLATQIYNVVVPASACLAAKGTYSMSIEMVIEAGVSPAVCTGAFLVGLRAAAAWGSKPGDPKWDPKYDLDKDGIISVNDVALFRISCPDVCNIEKLMEVYHTKVGDARYDPVYDFNEDGVINIFDSTLLGTNCAGE